MSTLVVTKRINGSKTFKRQVIKDKCAMYAMTIIFTLSYLLRTMFLISQIWLSPVCDGGYNPRTAYIDSMMFLALLPIFDTIPICVVLVYHVVTLRNVKPYTKAADDQPTKVDRLYSIDDFSDTDSSARMSTVANVHFSSVHSVLKQESRNASVTSFNSRMPSGNDLTSFVSQQQRSQSSGQTIGIYLEERRRTIQQEEEELLNDEFYNTPTITSESMRSESEASEAGFNPEKAKERVSWLMPSTDTK